MIILFYTGLRKLKVISEEIMNSNLRKLYFNLKLDKKYNLIFISLYICTRTSITFSIQ